MKLEPMKPQPPVMIAFLVGHGREFLVLGSFVFSWGGVQD